MTFALPRPGSTLGLDPVAGEPCTERRDKHRAHADGTTRVDTLARCTSRLSKRCAPTDADGRQDHHAPGRGLDPLLDRGSVRVEPGPCRRCSSRVRYGCTDRILPVRAERARRGWARPTLRIAADSDPQKRYSRSQRRRRSTIMAITKLSRLMQLKFVETELVSVIRSCRSGVNSARRGGRS
jgi:hypothetical protein